ncbi:tRNA dimethylallyltransferase [Rhodovulum bhavnagarense]|uniref:tRNA dimethylallyltransferase n=1 Tax=Rhodovulum bhavnagarense TaxID=992286 RepID=A0A4R2RKP3_9RHOB|nr:tRNA (adenosine(37)-N6)-dimethylallyltransferase MiaA [Rhodovulum bhavnagarense]TCP63388.1 tRNA dimethylallyltransferase [Rhodovulum bhavnagarense]
MDIPPLDPARPVLIAGPTASGKSALAMAIARAQGGVIVNADALQVFSTWRILTARPTVSQETEHPHALYGHVPFDAEYSVGHWLREIAPILSGDTRPIIVGGTGLYFNALTEGLAEIPATPPDIRAEAEARLAARGAEALLAELDAPSAGRIDRANPRRVQRAWEVLQATGRGLADWQDATPAPLLPLNQAQALVIEAPRDAINARIAARFDAMIAAGALEEVRAALPRWNARRQAAQAIGAPELVAHLGGETTLEAAIDAAKIASRQYAKRQRTWFRARLKQWERVVPDWQATDG